MRLYNAGRTDFVPLTLFNKHINGCPSPLRNNRLILPGLVKATATAKGELTALDIDPSIFREQDKEVVEDLILAAIKDAQRRAEGKAAEEMTRLTRELGLPADMKMPF